MELKWTETQVEEVVHDLQRLTVRRNGFYDAYGGKEFVQTGT
jgi:hypothetical protein